MKHLTISILALSALALAGCSEQSRTALEPDQALFAKPGSGGTTTEETDPMNIWDWQPTLSDGSTSALVAGDGRTVVSPGNESLVFLPTTGAYEGGLCGVRAKIFWSGTNFGGDAVFDADIEPNSSSCPTRSIRITLGSGSVVSDAPYMNVREIMDIATNETRQQRIRLNYLSNVPNCERIEFGTATSDPNDKPFLAESGGVYVTRTAGAARTRRGGKWVVETVAPHRGTCYYRSKGKDVAGHTYVLPFRILITELDSKGT